MDCLTRCRHRARLFLLAAAALAAGCDLHYRATAPPVEDEVLVRTVSSAMTSYDHPTRLSASEFGNILRGVRIQFKTHWLQKLITGPLRPVPLFDEPTLAKVVPALVETMTKAGTHERIVFYVAQRRSNDRRDVTTGTLFVKDGLLTIALANHQNRVDVVPGLTVYDRTHPETAVAPQRFLLVFDRPEYVIAPPKRGLRDLLGEVFEVHPPTLMVDYREYLQFASRMAAHQAGGR